MYSNEIDRRNAFSNGITAVNLVALCFANENGMLKAKHVRLFFRFPRS